MGLLGLAALNLQSALGANAAAVAEAQGKEGAEAVTSSMGLDLSPMPLNEALKVFGGDDDGTWGGGGLAWGVLIVGVGMWVGRRALRVCPVVVSAIDRVRPHTTHIYKTHHLRPSIDLVTHTHPFPQKPFCRRPTGRA